MEYSEQLKSPHWQKLRLQVLERNNWTCQNCQSKDKNLSVHHFYYLKNTKIWNYPPEHLTTLCNDCHKLYHDRLQELMEAFAETDTADLIQYFLNRNKNGFKSIINELITDDLYSFKEQIKKIKGIK